MKTTPRQRIVQFLERRKRNQDWMASELGISPQYLSMILTGKRTPSLDVAARIERLTGIKAVDFAGEDAASRLAS